MINYKNRNLPIGVFDSGVGGLTVVRALHKFLPNESIIYLGDTARVPYGNKSPKTIQQYSRNIAKFLAKKGVKLIVIACNTASAFAFKAVIDAVNVPVIDVISPVSRAIARLNTKHILVLGTHGTVQSAAYITQLRALRNDLTIVQQACPLFVPLVEEGWITGEIPEKIAEKYLNKIANTQSVILGCTHYPLLANVIEKTLSKNSKNILLFDSGEHAALEVKKTLQQLDICSSNKQAITRYLVTDSPESFIKTANIFIKEKIQHIQHIELTK